MISVGDTPPSATLRAKSKVMQVESMLETALGSPTKTFLPCHFDYLRQQCSGLEHEEPESSLILREACPVYFIVVAFLEAELLQDPREQGVGVGRWEWEAGLGMGVCAANLMFPSLFPGLRAHFCYY